MSGVGDLKNSLESMKRTLIRHKIPQLMNLTNHHLEEQYLKRNNPKIFLEITNFIMIQYSPLLYAEVLEKFPNIRSSPDKTFLEGSYVCIREFFDTFPALTIDQFLNPKFLELKIKFIDELVNLVVGWINKRSRQPVVIKEEKVDRKKPLKEEEYQQPRKINVKPTKIPKDCNQQLYTLQIQPEKITSLRYKPDNSTVDYLKSQSKVQKSLLYNPQQITYSRNRQQPIKLKPTNIYPEESLTYDLQLQPQLSQQNISSSTQAQINDLFELIGNVGLTVNQLVGKFNQFQQNVSGWVKNINAKVDILESTVKTIKDNL